VVVILSHRGATYCQTIIPAIRRFQTHFRQRALCFYHCYYFTCQLSPDDIPGTHLKKSRLIVCIFLTADSAEASERLFLQLSSRYANIFGRHTSTIFSRPKTICVTIAPYYGTDKNNPAAPAPGIALLFSYQDLRPHECDNH
jgi:hypothetical protein